MTRLVFDKIMYREEKSSFENDNHEDDGYFLKYFNNTITEEIQTMFMNFLFNLLVLILHNFLL